MRWLTLPAALAVVLLAAFALQAESRSAFDERQADRIAQGELRDRIENGSSIVLTTPDGSVVLSTDGETVVGEGGDGRALVLTPDPNGSIVGFRILDDGTIVPVEAGEPITDDTYVITSTSDGRIVLRRGDGRVIELDIGDDRVEATITTPEGEVVTRDSDDGALALDDLLEAAPGPDVEIVPADPAGGLVDEAAPDRIRPRDPEPSTTWFTTRNALIVLGAIGALALLAWLFRHLRPPPRREVADPETTNDQRPAASTPTLSGDAWAEFDHFCEKLRSHPDPTLAIRIMVDYLENGIGALDRRRPDETTDEWQRRIAATRPDLGAELQPITAQYLLIRFADRPATAPARDVAVDHLASLARRACGVVV